MTRPPRVEPKAPVGMDASTQRRLLGLLGLGVRGRGAVVGVERVREAAKKGLLAVAVVVGTAVVVGAPAGGTHGPDLGFKGADANLQCLRR